jgi:uncharacterized protein (TIGR02391 family)
MEPPKLSADEMRLVRRALQWAVSKPKGVPQFELDNELGRDSGDLVAGLLRKRLLASFSSVFLPTAHAMLYEPQKYEDELAAVQEALAYGKQVVRRGEIFAKVDELVRPLAEKIPALSNAGERRLFECALFGLEPFIMVQQIAPESGAPVLVTFGAKIREVATLDQIREYQAEQDRERLALDDQFGRVELDTDTDVERGGAASSEPISIDLRHFHTEVAKTSAALGANGHHRQAIIDAFIGVESAVQRKTGLKDTGDALMSRAFSARAPVLRLSEHEEEQAGFMFLFKGAVKAVRNPYAHRLISPESPIEALEWLALASALHRLLDRAEVSGGLPR